MLSDRQQNFVREYCVDFNATKAYIRAGYSEGGASTGASLLLANPKVQEAVEVQKMRVAAAAGLSAATILQEWMAVALGDPRRLIHSRVGCCRYCYGIDHKRQWTRVEYMSAMEDALAVDRPAPPMAGGIGFDLKLEPNPDCPECGGEGLQRVWMADMRSLDAATARLIAGVKQTKEGIEVKFRDQDNALQYLAKYLGMLTEKRELSGPGGGPIPLQAMAVQDMTDEQLLALVTGGGPLLLEGEK